jgi:hypothetical protein
MPRHPAGTGDRAPPGAAAHASAPSPSFAPSPSRYRALRARYNALLVTLYERSSLTLREIALVAGRTNRAVQVRVRALGCRPRNAKTCRPGTSVGVRRAGPKPPPLNTKATRRVVAAFADVARELAASAQMQAASELQRATARAERRSARTQARVMASAARQLTHLAATMEHVTAAQDALAGRHKHAGTRKPAQASKPRSRADAWEAQQRVLRQQQARMSEAHQAADRAKAAPAAGPPGSDADAGASTRSRRAMMTRRGSGRASAVCDQSTRAQNPSP